MGRRSEFARAVSYLRDLIAVIQLDLSGFTVYTEAASGPYCVTPSIAALAGAANVYALARDSRFGPAQEAAETVLRFAAQCGIQNRVQVVYQKRPEHLAQADIVTNSGHLRPIDEMTVVCLKPTAVVPLMYEAWEYRSQDLDLKACRSKGIPVAGTDETHPLIGILDYLGVMAVKLLLEGQIEIVGSTILVWSDNKFCKYITRSLAVLGARLLLACPFHYWEEMKDVSAIVTYLGEPQELPRRLMALQGFDALVLAMAPSRSMWISQAASRGTLAASDIAAVAPGALVVQLWGDIDRHATIEAGLRLVPEQAPPPQHMGVLPSDLGMVPVIRLQAGGLKVGEIMARARRAGCTPRDAEQAAFEAGYATLLI